MSISTVFFRGLEHNLGTYIRARVSSISLPNRLIWTGEKFIEDRREKHWWFVLAFGIAFLIASAGTYLRFLAQPSASLRQSDDVCDSFFDSFIEEFCFVD